MSDVCRYLNI